jgi:opacity protein-like surface antigen
MRTAGLAIATLVVWISFVPAAVAQGLERVEVSLNAAGVFSKTVKSTNGVVTDTPTKSLAVFGSVQYRFAPMHSLELTIGHTNNSQVFLVSPDTYRMAGSITEYSGAYVFNPFSTKRWEPFLLGGLGGLRFSPGNTYFDGLQEPFGATQQTSLAFVYGGGADYRVWRSLSVRLQYRGFLYKAPDFKVQPLFTGARGHMAEPSIGIAMKF